MSDPDPRFPAGPDPEDGAGSSAAESDLDRMAGFFDETVLDPESGPGSEGDNDLLILRNMNDEFAAAQAEDEQTRREREAEEQRRAEERSQAEAERRAAQEKAAEEAAARAREEEAVRAREERAAAMFIEPDLRPTPPPTPEQELAAAAAASARARRAAARPRRRRQGPRAPLPSTIAAVAGAAALVACTFLAAARTEPFHTWYYVFAWYPFLMAINHVTAMRSPDHSFFAGRFRTLAVMLAWSVPMWLVFEALNFRLENWYYIGVPRELLWRRLGVVVSFATVLPGVMMLEETLRVRGVFAGVKSPAFAWRERWDRIVLGVGAAWAILVMALPQFFFPLVWGIPVLLLEPWLRRDRGPSLIRDLSEGSPGRILRLLTAGMICGLWWEGANTIAGGKWIYTVPGLSALRPFEMPLFGFIGFAPFALCLWTMARALVRLGLLPDWERVEPRRETPDDVPAQEAEAEADTTEPEAADAAAAPGILAEPADVAALDAPSEEDPTAATEPAARPRGPGALAPVLAFLRGPRGAAVAAVVFSLIVLTLMDRWTIDSFTATSADVPGVPDGVPEYAREHGLDSVRGLLHLIREGALYVPGESNARMVADLENACRLSLLHGIGTDNARRLIAAGVGSVEELAAANPRELTAALASLDEKGWRPRIRRVEEWVRAARHEAPVAALTLVAPAGP